MGQNTKLVVSRGAPTKHRREEFVKGTAQLETNALTKDAPIKSRKEESAKGTAQKRYTKLVVMRGVLTLLRREEYAEGRSESH